MSRAQLLRLGVGAAAFSTGWTPGGYVGFGAASMRSGIDRRGGSCAGGRRVDVSVSRAQRPAAGIVLHRTALPTDEIATREGLRVTSAARTLLDLAAVLDPHRLRRAIEEAEVLRLHDRLSLEELFERHPRRPGVAALRNLLDEGVGPTTTRSELEDRFLGFLGSHGLPRPQVNQSVEGFEVDLQWPESRLVVELDGQAFHAPPHAFERDRR